MNSQPTSVGDALRKAVDYSTAMEAHKRNQRRSAKAFGNFVSTTFAIKNCDELRPIHVKAWADQMRSDGLAANYIRQQTNVVRLYNNWACDNLGLMALPVQRFIPKRHVPTKKYLTLDQLMVCIRKAAEMRERAALLGFVLGGLAGLRMSEIMRLTDADLRNDEVWIRGETKNDSSRRVVPIPRIAREILESHLDYHRKSTRWGDRQALYGTIEHLSRKMSKVLNACHESYGNPIFNEVTPRDATRHTFCQIAMDLIDSRGIKHPEMLVQAYVGQAPQSVLMRYYVEYVPRPDAPTEVRNRALLHLRKAITLPIEAVTQEVRIQYPEMKARRKKK